MKCLKDETCEICDGNLCNGYEFPREKLLCHQCEGIPECLIEILPKTCVKNEPNDACVSLFDTESKIIM